jgi:hypothetical protein
MERAKLLYEHKVDFKAPCLRNDDRFYQALYWLDISGKDENRIV